jgi:hypothetical protein
MLQYAANNIQQAIVEKKNKEMTRIELTSLEDSLEHLKNLILVIDEGDTNWTNEADVLAKEYGITVIKCTATPKKDESAIGVDLKKISRTRTELSQLSQTVKYELSAEAFKLGDIQEGKHSILVVKEGKEATEKYEQYKEEFPGRPVFIAHSSGGGTYKYRLDGQKEDETQQTFDDVKRAFCNADEGLFIIVEMGSRGTNYRSSECNNKVKKLDIHVTKILNNKALKQLVGRGMRNWVEDARVIGYPQEKTTLNDLSWYYDITFEKWMLVKAVPRRNDKNQDIKFRSFSTIKESQVRSGFESRLNTSEIIKLSLPMSGQSTRHVAIFDWFSGIKHDVPYPKKWEEDKPLEKLRMGILKQLMFGKDIYDALFEFSIVVGMLTETEEETAGEMLEKACDWLGEYEEKCHSLPIQKEWLNKLLVEKEELTVDTIQQTYVQHRYDRYRKFWSEKRGEAMPLKDWWSMMVKESSFIPVNHEIIDKITKEEEEKSEASSKKRVRGNMGASSKKQRRKDKKKSLFGNCTKKRAKSDCVPLGRDKNGKRKRFRWGPLSSSSSSASSSASASESKKSARLAYSSSSAWSSVSGSGSGSGLSSSSSSRSVSVSVSGSGSGSACLSVSGSATKGEKKKQVISSRARLIKKMNKKLR